MPGAVSPTFSETEDPVEAAQGWAPGRWLRRWPRRVRGTACLVCLGFRFASLYVLHERLLLKHKLFGSANSCHGRHFWKASPGESAGPGQGVSSWTS